MERQLVCYLSLPAWGVYFRLTFFYRVLDLRFVGKDGISDDEMNKLLEILKDKKVKGGVQ